MKKVQLNSMFAIAMSGLLLTSMFFVAGCGPSDPKPDPDARVPNVPASTRGDGGGVPGASDDVKKKKTSHYIIKQTEAVQS